MHNRSTSRVGVVAGEGARCPHRAERSVLLIILLATVIRVGLAASTGLGVDESYWVSVSRFPSLGFIDDAPMQAWLVAGARWLFGSEAALPLRLPFIALFAASSWLMFRLTAQFFGARAGLWAVVALNLAPVFTLADGTWILPDGALIFFQLAVACVLANILFQHTDRDDRKVLWWLAAGALGGCALLSKYHGVFLFLGALVFLLTVPDQRRWLRTAGPWLGAAVALAVFSPAIIWNVTHDWAGVAFQFERVGSSAAHGLMLQLDGEGSQTAHPWTGTIRMFGGALLFLGWLIVPLAFVLVRAFFRGPGQPTTWFLVCLAVGPIAVFGSVSLWASQQFPHWPMPGWLFVFPLLGAAWAALEARRPMAARFSMIAWAVALLTVVGVLIGHIRLDAPGFAALRLPLHSDPTVGLKDWEELRTTLAERGLIDAATPAVAAAHWMDAAKVAYALGANVPVVCVCRIPQQFPYLYDPTQFAGSNMIVVGDKLTMRRQQWLARHFARFEPLEPVHLYRAGAVVKTLKLYRGINFNVDGSQLPRGIEEMGSVPSSSARPRRPNDAFDCRFDGENDPERACWVD